MTTRAEIRQSHAYLFPDFGDELARKWFTAEDLSSIPCFTRGKHKGKLKGVVIWRKVISGGWIHNEGEVGRVEKRVGQIINKQLRIMPKFGEDPIKGKLVAQHKMD